MWISSTCGRECNKICKIDEFIYIKKFSCEKFCKLLLACEDEILNTTET